MEAVLPLKMKNKYLRHGTPMAQDYTYKEFISLELVVLGAKRGKFTVAI